jgi:hypothetical protein
MAAASSLTAEDQLLKAVNEKDLSKVVTLLTAGADPFSVIQLSTGPVSSFDQLFRLVLKDDHYEAVSTPYEIELFELFLEKRKSRRDRLNCYSRFFGYCFEWAPELLSYFSKLSIFEDIVVNSHVFLRNYIREFESINPFALMRIVKFKLIKEIIRSNGIASQMIGFFHLNREAFNILKIEETDDIDDLLELLDLLRD